MCWPIVCTSYGPIYICIRRLEVSNLDMFCLHSCECVNHVVCGCGNEKVVCSDAGRDGVVRTCYVEYAWVRL